VTQYLVRRLLLNVVVIFLLVTLVFILMRLIPGDAVLAQLSEERALAPEQIEFIRHELGLDKSPMVQYWEWMTALVRGDFGNSLVDRLPVSDAILRAIPISVQLSVIAITTSVLIGIPVGILSATRRNSLPDYLMRFFAVLGLALPNFWLGIIYIIVPALLLGYSPPVAYAHFIDDPWTNLQIVLPPALILGLGSGAIVMRMMRSTMLEVLGSDYVRTARSKGLTESSVIIRHALRNSLLPVLTIVGAQISAIVGGSVVMETLFGIPGMGRLGFRALTERDYTMVQSLVLLFGVILVTVNLLVDLLYSYIDPRIRYS
jgi:peptide/nickel transport system permease protein